jgi:hypothetical protein
MLNRQTGAPALCAPVVIAFLTSIAVPACVYEVEADLGRDVAVQEAPLYLTGNLWPDDTVPVCWAQTTATRPDFDNFAGEIKQAVLTSWSEFSNVEFTGWNTCPNDTSGRIKINLRDTGPSNSGGGYPGTGTRVVNFNVTDNRIVNSVAIHEFGHALGFAHEMEHPGFPNMGGDCKLDGNGGGDDLGTPPDVESIMAATGYCTQNRLLSRWDIVGLREAYGTRADNVVSSGGTLYARKLSNGSIYKRSGSSWTKIGGPGGQFITVGATLFALTPTSDAVMRYNGSGTSWTSVGGAARTIFRCAGSLCAEDPDDGDVYRLQAGGWARIASRAAMYASTASNIYRLTTNRSQIQQYDGSGTGWTKIGDAAAAIYSTTLGLYALSPDGSTLSHYTPFGWEEIGGAARTFVGVGSSLYRLSTSRSAVYRYSGSGSSWTRVGNAADWIYGGESGSLYATNPDSKTIYRYTGSGTSWEQVGLP